MGESSRFHGGKLLTYAKTAKASLLNTFLPSWNEMAILPSGHNEADRNVYVAREVYKKSREYRERLMRLSHLKETAVDARHQYTTELAGEEDGYMSDHQ